MLKPLKFKCNSCGMIFFKFSTKLLKKGKKDLTCPYCESKLWTPIMIK